VEGAELSITNHNQWRHVLSIIIICATCVSISCERSDIQIRYLRSESYAFSRNDRAAITAIAESTAEEVRSLLPSLPERIELTVRPGADVMKETGAAGVAMPPNGVMWTVDPSRRGGVIGTAKSWLRATLFHEFHHLVRSASGSPHSLVEHAVFEGLATAFERDHAGVSPPWGQYSDGIANWANELMGLPVDAPVNSWLYAHPDGRRWIGMRVGTFWVDRATAKSGRSASTLATVPADEILAMAGQGAESAPSVALP
jgi:hypothetical protein